MDTWKFFDITHREHTICNPSSLETYQQFVDLLRLPTDSSVLELAVGKGEFIIRLAEQYGVHGVGVDLAPNRVRDARARLAERAPEADVTFLEMNGADYQPDEPESHDLTVCMGASWIFDGHKNTLAALKSMTKPGGQVLVGEPFWRSGPDPEYLKEAGFELDLFGTHHANVQTGEELGLTLLFSLVSDVAEWDRYEGLQWYASEEYALAYPDDPDVPELLERVRSERHAYLRWGRDTLGWALYLFRK